MSIGSPCFEKLNKHFTIFDIVNQKTLIAAAEERKADWYSVRLTCNGP